MTDRDRELAQVSNPLLYMSTVAWILLLAGPGTLQHCPVAPLGTVSWRASFLMLVNMAPPASLATSWALMLVAMMSPALIPPIGHVWLQSFQHRRIRSIGLFVFGYSAIWLIVGALLLTVELAVAVFARQWYLWVAGALTALLWQLSPIKQHCLNRGRAHTPLAAFGLAADRDALGFGVRHGIWCVGSCWALMMFPMLLPSGHVVAMAAVAVLVFGERLEQPRPPRWRWRGLGKAIRIVVAQARIRLSAYRLASAAISSGT